MEDELYETDELENAIDNLEMLNHFIEVPMTGSRWKWATIAAHQALYGFLICALKGTAPLLTVCEPDFKRGDGKKSKARLSYLRRDSISAIASSLGVKERDVKEWINNPRLISLREALRRIREKEYLPWSNSKPLEASPDEDEALRRLIEVFRNNFEHFVPKSWVIYTESFPMMFQYVMRVMQFIALESNSVFLYPDEEDERRIKQALQSIEGKLQELNSKNTPE